MTSRSHRLSCPRDEPSGNLSGCSPGATRFPVPRSRPELGSRLGDRLAAAAGQGQP